MFGQLYLHVEKLGHADNIEQRSNEMLRASMDQGDADKDQDVVVTDAE